MISKLKRFSEVSTSPYVLEHDKNKIKKELKKFIQKDRPLVLELGCGGGEYTIALAETNPDKQFMGIDIQGERLWYGMKAIEENKLNNALFIRDYIDNIDKHFKKRSIDEIWITFPDPYPKKKKAKKRLTSPKFLKMYKKLIKPSGLINLKTDNYDLYKYSKDSVTEFGGKIIKATEDIYKNPEELTKELKIKTYFEGKHLKVGRKIYHLQFKVH